MILSVNYKLWRNIENHQKLKRENLVVHMWYHSQPLDIPQTSFLTRVKIKQNILDMFAVKNPYLWFLLQNENTSQNDLQIRIAKWWLLHTEILKTKKFV